VAEPVTLEVADGVATLLLNRPQVGNALDMELTRALHAAAVRCDSDPAIRAVLLTGAGRFFCVGGDLKYFAGLGEGVGAVMREMAGVLHAAVARLTRMRPPMVIAVNGAAGGAGISLSLLGDIALAARSATFTVAYTAAGLTPDGGSTFLLPRIVGLRRAQELIFENRRLTAAEAVDWGMMTRAVDDASLLDEARAVARRLAQGPTGAYGGAKRLLAESMGAFETQMERETEMIAARGMSADGREGVRAFLEKRPPKFSGA